MKCQGVWASGTSYISFENVRVHKRYLIGELNEGFKLIMFNFNHERLGFGQMAEGFMQKLLKVCLTHIKKHRLENDAIIMGY